MTTECCTLTSVSPATRLGQKFGIPQTFGTTLLMIMTEGDGCDDNSDGDGCDDDSDGGGCDMIVTEGSGCGLY